MFPQLMKAVMEENQEVDFCAFHLVTAEFAREGNRFDPRDLVIVQKAKARGGS